MTQNRLKEEDLTSDFSYQTKAFCILSGQLSKLMKSVTHHSLVLAWNKQFKKSNYDIVLFCRTYKVVSLVKLFSRWYQTFGLIFQLTTLLGIKNY